MIEDPIISFCDSKIKNDKPVLKCVFVLVPDGQAVAVFLLSANLLSLLFQVVCIVQNKLVAFLTL